jgi:hypothetical protein
MTTPATPPTATPATTAITAPTAGTHMPAILMMTTILMMIASMTEAKPEKIPTTMMAKRTKSIMMTRTSKKEKNKGKPKMAPMNEVKTWVTQGWEYVNSLPNNEAIIRLPVIA